MKITVITQARYSSSRFPGKVLKGLGSRTVLDLHLKRIKKSKYINQFIVATTTEPESSEIEQIAQRNQFNCFHGNLNDVLDRFYQAVKDNPPDYVVRLTSDCPLIDSFYIDDLIEKFLTQKVDYASNCMIPTLPDGMDVEVFTFKSLKSAWEESTKLSEREHVTPFIRNSGRFTTYSVEYPENLGHLRFTLDTKEDYDLLNKLVDEVGEDGSTEDYVQCFEANPQWKDINSSYERNEGLKKSLENDK